MLTPNNINELNEQILQNFDNKKVLLFCSDQFEASKKFENNLNSIEDELQDNNITLFLIKQNGNLDSLFKQFKIEEVPTSIILNVNLNVLKTLTNISPADIVLETLNMDNIFESNENLQNDKYNKKCIALKNQNQLIVFEFSKNLNNEYQQCKDYLTQKTLSYRELSKEHFKEENPIIIYGYCCKELFNKIDNKKQYPIGIFNQKWFYNLEDLQQIYENNKNYFQTILNNDIQNLKQFMDKNKILFIIKTNEQNVDEQNNILDELEQENLRFGYIDLQKKQNLIPYIKTLINQDQLNYPILKNEKNVYYQGDQLKDQKWKELIEYQNKQQKLDEFINQILKSERIIVFIKGSPEFPECKYSRKIVDYLNSKNIEYGHFNIFTNQELRERLKVLKNWKTYPQLYIDEQLIGGNDIILEMEELGQMDELFKPSLKNQYNQFKLINENKKNNWI